MRVPDVYWMSQRNCAAVRHHAFGIQPDSFMRAMHCAAKASLSSISSTSLRFQPALAALLLTASTGAIITSFGSRPEVACATIRASGAH